MVALYQPPQYQVIVLTTIHRFREGYGMTEMSPAVTFTRKSMLSTGGSSGQLLPNTRLVNYIHTVAYIFLLFHSMKVVDLVTGEEKGVGETGELCFQGPQVNTRLLILTVC